jgi:MoaD family protein
MSMVTVRYFARLREERGLPQERIETDAPTIGALYETLAADHGLSLPPDKLRASVNGVFADWGAPINDGDEIAYLPPVTGG